jgi:NhaP-type Na+/H+ or K+/H+ antiporter
MEHLLYHEFVPYRDRNAMAVCVYAFFGLSVMPSALFILPLPPSLKAVPVFGHVVAIILLVGCIGALWAMFRKNVDKALNAEQLFSGVLGVGFILYATAVLRAAWLTKVKPYHWYEIAWTAGSLYVVGVVLGMAAFCIWRFLQIRRYIKRRTGVKVSEP